MIILGIELSTAQGSVALFKGGALLAEKIWTGQSVRHGVLFENLETLLRDARISYNDISLYAVGRGPGSFSGMRMAFAAAQALALPGGADVRAVSSGAALALATVREIGAKRIAVVGDARRGQCWYGLFKVEQASLPVQDRLEASLALIEDWKLVPYEKLVIPQGSVVVSPDAERLAPYLPSIGKSFFPLARHVAELAQTQSEPLEPLYMHPPVFVPPKYLEK